jgi:MBG domain (YGX type)
VGGDAINYSLSTTATKFSNAGDYTITVTLGSNPNYNVSKTDGTLHINKANQTISWTGPGAITVGTVLSGAQLNATVAGVAGGTPPGALTYTPPAGTVLGAGANQSLKVDAAATINYNPATKTVNINVNYTFVGFLQPIDNMPTVNSVKAGQTIPVKWQLKDAAGNLISDLGSLASSGLQSVKIACDTGAPVDAVEELAAPGSTMFRFDGTQFIFNWQTTKSWAGTCRLMTVTLKDGNIYSAQFTFK